MKRVIKSTIVGLGLLVAWVATPALSADLSVCIWGTITGPDALVNGMSYGTRDYFEFLNQAKGGIGGNKVQFCSWMVDTSLTRSLRTIAGASIRKIRLRKRLVDRIGKGIA